MGWGRRRSQEPALPLEREVPVALTEAEVEEKSARVRGLLRAIKGLEAKVRDDTRSSRKAIKEHKAEIDQLLDAIDQGIEMRKQGDLFAKEDATKTLHDVVAKVDPEIAAAFSPSSPHPYQANGSKDECGLCGSTARDPIHAGKANELVESLQRVNGGEPVREVLDDIKGRRKGRGGKRGKEARP